MSSGATPESDHSRQSIDPLVRRPGRPILSNRPRRGVSAPSDPFGSFLAEHLRVELTLSGRRRREVADGCPHRVDRSPANRRDGLRPQGSEPRCGTRWPAGATSEEAAPAVDQRAESRRKPEGSRRTAPSRCPRPRPGGHRFRAPSQRNGMPSHRFERARGAGLARSCTQIDGRPFIVATSEATTQRSEERLSPRTLPSGGFDSSERRGHESLSSDNHRRSSPIEDPRHAARRRWSLE
jgi:hypothetical protein